MILTTTDPKKVEVPVVITVSPEGTGIVIMANDSKILKINRKGTYTRYILDHTDTDLGFQPDSQGKLQEKRISD